MGEVTSNEMQARGGPGRGRRVLRTVGQSGGRPAGSRALSHLAAAPEEFLDAAEDARHRGRARPDVRGLRKVVLVAGWEGGEVALHYQALQLCVCMCASVRACVRACVCVCVSKGV